MYEEIEKNCCALPLTIGDGSCYWLLCSFRRQYHRCLDNSTRKDSDPTAIVTIIALWPYYWAGRPSGTVRQETCPLFGLLTVSPNPGEMRPSAVKWGSVAATHIYPTWEYAPSIVHGTAPTSTSGNSFCTFLSPTSEAKMQSSLILLAEHGNIVGLVRRRESDAYLGCPSPWSCAKRLLRFRQWRLRGPV